MKENIDNLNALEIRGHWELIGSPKGCVWSFVRRRGDLYAVAVSMSVKSFNFEDAGQTYAGLYCSW